MALNIKALLKNFSQGFYLLFHFAQQATMEV